jgi:hypothetical protein
LGINGWRTLLSGVLRNVQAGLERQDSIEEIFEIMRHSNIGEPLCDFLLWKAPTSSPANHVTSSRGPRRAIPPLHITPQFAAARSASWASLEIDSETGWIVYGYATRSRSQTREEVDGRIQICWLPPELRLGDVFLQWSQTHKKAVIGAHSGVITIIDFSGIIQELQLHNL